MSTECTEHSWVFNTGKRSHGESPWMQCMHCPAEREVTQEDLDDVYTVLHDLEYEEYLSQKDDT